MAGIYIKRSLLHATVFDSPFWNGIFCWKWLHMQPDLAVYLAVPFSLRCFVLVLKYQGMTPVELVKEMVFEYRTKFLLYDAEEVPEPQIFTMESIIHSGIDRKEWKRLRKKHKKRKGQ